MVEGNKWKLQRIKAAPKAIPANGGEGLPTSSHLSLTHVKEMKMKTAVGKLNVK